MYSHRQRTERSINDIESMGETLRDEKEITGEWDGSKGQGSLIDLTSLSGVREECDTLGFL